ncbi:hypothetical protein BDQ17DRAFT_1546559 [Cyathus striatus]|nr:hypothetical protein BDQ17DRAFT_1546559 [Cyathus striatus]
MTPMSVRFILISSAVIGICIGLFTAAASLLVVRPVNFKVPDNYLGPAEVPFVKEVISVDPIARTFTMDWYPQMSCPRPGENATEKVIDIYLDQGVIDPGSPAFSILPPYSPVYRLNITAICNSQVSTLLSFRTTSKLLNSNLAPGFQGPLSSTLQNYPFDVYYAPFYIYGLDTDTGEYVALNVTRSFGEVVNFQISLYNSHTTIASPWLRYVLRVERSRATKIFVIMVGITNWLTAVAFILISVSTLIYHSHKIYSEMFVVPVGAVFAFTTIRAGFPGAPSGFGATIDLFTILPVLIIMSLCSFFLLLIILYRRIGIYVNIDEECCKGVRNVDRKGSTSSESSTSSDSYKRMRATSNIYVRLFNWLLYNPSP